MSCSWQNILVSPLITIYEVLKVIDDEGLRLALVVDGDNRLLGSVSDGDVRRALIEKKALNTPVSEIMHTSPTTASIGTPRSKILEVMDELGLLAIPIVEAEKIVGLETIHQIIHKQKYDNPVFLMAGGFGIRLRPLTDNCPKPLLRVGDKPILETILLYFIKAGFKNFYISTHYLPEMIHEYFGNGQQWGVSINYVHESEPLGTGGALGLLPPDLPQLPIIMMNADVLTKVDFEQLLHFHNKNDAHATMCVREYEYQVPFGVITSDGHNIKSMVEKPTYRFHVNAGIYVVGREIIESVKPDERIDMPTLLERHLENKVLMYPFYEYWLDIGRMDDFHRAQEDIQHFGN